MNKIIEIVVEVVFIATLVWTGATLSEHNSRIELCEELNMVYTNNDQCITKLEYDLKSKTSKDYILENVNNIKVLNIKNGTISQLD